MVQTKAGNGIEQVFGGFMNPKNIKPQPASKLSSWEINRAKYTAEQLAEIDAAEYAMGGRGKGITKKDSQITTRGKNIVFQVKLPIPHTKTVYEIEVARQEMIDVLNANRDAASNKNLKFQIKKWHWKNKATRYPTHDEETNWWFAAAKLDIRRVGHEFQWVQKKVDGELGWYMKDLPERIEMRKFFAIGVLNLTKTQKTIKKPRDLIG
jgi:hypothetical protein